MSDLSLRREDAMRSIHYRMGRKLGARWFHDDGRRFDETVERNDPSMRAAIGSVMACAWALLAMTAGLSIFVGFGVRAAAGNSAALAVAYACLAVAMFCIAGMWICLWRAYWYSWRAKRLAPYGVNEEERYAAAMRRTLPRNTSVVFQLAFAVLVTIWVSSMP